MMKVCINASTGWGEELANRGYSTVRLRVCFDGYLFTH